MTNISAPMLTVNKSPTLMVTQICIYKFYYKNLLIVFGKLIKIRKMVLGELLNPYLCFVSFLYLDLHVLKDVALIS